MGKIYYFIIKKDWQNIIFNIRMNIFFYVNYKKYIYVNLNF